MSEQTTSTETLSSPYTRRVLFEVHRKYDMDIHVSKVDIEDRTYVDIREFIPSLSQYGRGITLPPETAVEAAKAILQRFEEVTDVEPTDV